MTSSGARVPNGTQTRLGMKVKWSRRSTTTTSASSLSRRADLERAGQAGEARSDDHDPWSLRPDTHDDPLELDDNQWLRDCRGWGIRVVRDGDLGKAEPVGTTTGSRRIRPLRAAAHSLYFCVSPGD